MSTQARAQNGQVEMAAPFDRLALRRGVKALGLQEVGVDPAGEQHPNQEGLLEALMRATREPPSVAQGIKWRQNAGMSLPSRVGFDCVIGL
jgi:hypothetical protein